MTRSRPSPAITSRMRLRDYDYAQAGADFITLCTQHRTHRFGRIEDGVMDQSPAGVVVESWWHSIPLTFPSVATDTMIVMPNHVHGILFLGTEPEVTGPHPSHSDVVSWFKSRTTHDYILGVRREGWPRFDGRLWQPRFHDHIVRTDQALGRIRGYMQANPSRWSEDRSHGD